MDESVHIDFEHNGKKYSGSLAPVSGAGGNTWYLMINKHYYGRLRQNEKGWIFDGEFRDLAAFFGETVLKERKQ